MYTKKLKNISKFLIVSIFIILFNFSSTQAKVKLGIDVLQDSNFSQLKGKRIALLANFASRNSAGQLSFSVLRNQKTVKLIKVFTPEHGFYTTVSAGEHVGNMDIDSIPCISLYGAARKPTANDLKNIDAILIDLQDVGVRSYTFISTVFNVMQSAAENGKEIIIADRPNPLGGESFNGNLVDSAYKSFISILPIPYVHGMTFGELTEYINNENLLSKSKKLKCKLTIIKMQNWSRSMVWEDTGLKWYSTSPNVPSVDAIRGMTVLGCIGELGNSDIGINNPLPFQTITLYGNRNKFESDLNFLAEMEEMGVYLEFTKRTNNKNEFTLYLDFKKEAKHRYYTAFLLLLNKLNEVYPEKFQAEKIKENNLAMFRKATGKADILEQLSYKDTFLVMLQKFEQEAKDFNQTRLKYLIYK